MHRKNIPSVKVRAGLACEVSAVETSPQAYMDWIGLDWITLFPSGEVRMGDVMTKTGLGK